MIELRNRHFKMVSDSNVKDIGASTCIQVDQDGEIFFGTYHGGKVIKGSFMAKLTEANKFERFFHHYNNYGDLVSGRSEGKIEVLPDGRLRLSEQWSLGSQITGDAIYDEDTEAPMSDGFYFNLSLNK